MADFLKLINEVIDAQNEARMNPSSFIVDLEQLLKLYQGNIVYKPGEIPLQTNEGRSAVLSCIEFLRKQQPLGQLTKSEDLCKAAQDHASDIGPKGIVGHSGSDGSSMSTRIERYTQWSGNIGENIEFGGKTGREIIINLMVDDGVSSRGHRNNIFNPKFNLAGIGIASHRTYGICTVIDYATEVSSGNQRFNTQQQQQSFNLPQFGAPNQGQFPTISDNRRNTSNLLNDFNFQNKFTNKFTNTNFTNNIPSNTNNNIPTNTNSNSTFDYNTGFNNTPITTNVNRNFTGFNQNNNIQDKFGNYFVKQTQQNQPNSTKRVVGQSQSTQVVTKNGRRQTTTEITLTYSDGSTEKRIEEKIE